MFLCFIGTECQRYTVHIDHIWHFKSVDFDLQTQMLIVFLFAQNFAGTPTTCSREARSGQTLDSKLTAWPHEPS